MTVPVLTTPAELYSRLCHGGPAPVVPDVRWRLGLVAPFSAAPSGPYSATSVRRRVTADRCGGQPPSPAGRTPARDGPRTALATSSRTRAAGTVLPGSSEVHRNQSFGPSPAGASPR